MRPLVRRVARIITRIDTFEPAVYLHTADKSHRPYGKNIRTCLSSSVYLLTQLEGSHGKYDHGLLGLMTAKPSSPVCQRPLASVQQGIGEVIEGALAVVAPVAVAAGSVVVHAPRIDMATVASGTLQRAIFPPQCVDVGLTLFCAEKWVDMGEHWHEEESPGSG
jgi:hypothetical protein